MPKMIKMAKVTAVQIIEKLKTMHICQNPPWAFYAEVKTGPSWGQGGHKLYIMDAIAIKCSWSKPCIAGFEVKITRSDFLRDKKWQNYQKYCHKFSFVCPVATPPIIRLDELPGDVGLIYYSAEHDCLFTKRRAMYREIDLRSPEVVGMLMYLAMYRAAAGADWSRVCDG